MLQIKQQRNVREALDLFTRVQITFARMEVNGVKIDVPYLHQAITDTEKMIAEKEQLLWQSDIGKLWRKIHGNNASLTARQQLGTVLFKNTKNPHPDNLGYTCKEFTPTGQPQVSEETIEKIPGIGRFSYDYSELMAFKKLFTTYLVGIKGSIDKNDFIHPSFSLFSAITFRSASSSPNWHNVPKHNPVMAKIVRQCYIPRSPDRHFVEIDFSGAEVRTSAVITQDPTLLASIDQGVDFHKSVAAMAFILPEKEITKDLRQAVKGPFTFQAFYGGFWGQIAKALWDLIEYGIGGIPLSLKDGEPMKAHLARQGITELGDMSDPRPGTYYFHIKQCEDRFWKDMFPVYAEWKEKNWLKYLKNGYVDIPSGFRVASVSVKNQVNNAPSQGSAAHGLLWSLTRIDDILQKYKMKSCIVGQIHDSMNIDADSKELDDIVEIAHDVMEKQLVKEWRWLPKMEIEVEVAPAGKSWWHVKKYPPKCPS